MPFVTSRDVAVPCGSLAVLRISLVRFECGWAANRQRYSRKELVRYRAGE